MDAGRRSRQAATSPPTARLTPDRRRSDDASSRGRRAASWRCANPTQPSPRHAFDQRIRLRSPARPPANRQRSTLRPARLLAPPTKRPRRTLHSTQHHVTRLRAMGAKGLPPKKQRRASPPTGSKHPAAPRLAVRCARYLPFGFAAAAAAAAAAACLARLGLRYAKYAATPATTTTTTMPATTAPVVAPSSGADWLTSVVS